MEKVCAVSDVPKNSMKTFDVQGRQIMVVNADGKWYATQALCTHRGGALAQGTLEGTCVTCPRHKAQFDVKTGAVVKDVGGVMKLLTAGGAQPLTTYRVIEKNGSIFIT